MSSVFSPGPRALVIAVALAGCAASSPDMPPEAAAEVNRIDAVARERLADACTPAEIDILTGQFAAFVRAVYAEEADRPMTVAERAEAARAAETADALAAEVSPGCLAAARTRLADL